MTLLSLASKQIWPQVLAVLHARPQRLLLLHSDEEGESKRPAERLRDLFQAGGIPQPPVVALKGVPSLKDPLSVPPAPPEVGLRQIILPCPD